MSWSHQQHFVWLTWGRIRTTVLACTVWCVYYPSIGYWCHEVARMGHGISVICLWRILLAVVRDFLFLALGFVSFPLGTLRCVGNFKCQRCSKTLARENTLPSCSTCLLPASLPGGWAHLPCLLKLGICPSWTSSARIGEGSSWWWETVSLCMD